MSSFKQEVWGSVWLLLLLLLSQRFSKPTDNRFEGNTRMTSVTGNNRMVCRRTCFDCRLRSARWHSCYDLCLHVMCFYPTSTAEELGQSKYSLHTHTRSFRLLVWSGDVIVVSSCCWPLGGPWSSPWRLRHSVEVDLLALAWAQIQKSFNLSISLKRQTAFTNIFIWKVPYLHIKEK